jgi:hypothetical protein
MRRSALLLIPISIAVFASAASAQDAKPPQPPPPGAGAVADPSRLPDLVKLTEKDVTGFIAASTKLRKLGLDEEAETQEEAETMAAELSRNKQALAIIDEHGFTPERFQSVAYSIGMALAADEIKKTPEEIKAMRAQQEQQLAQMKAQLPPEQYEQMKAQLAMANHMADQLQKLPPGNVELVRKHAAAIHGAVGQ